MQHINIYKNCVLNVCLLAMTINFNSSSFVILLKEEFSVEQKLISIIIVVASTLPNRTRTSVDMTSRPIYAVDHCVSIFYVL